MPAQGVGEGPTLRHSESMDPRCVERETTWNQQSPGDGEPVGRDDEVPGWNDSDEDVGQDGLSLP